jgi:hypothetical protein
MYSLCVNALFRFSIKRRALITLIFPLGPRCHERIGQKDVMQVLIINTYNYIRNICLHMIDELELLCTALGCYCYMMNAIQIFIATTCLHFLIILSLVESLLSLLLLLLQNRYCYQCYQIYHITVLLILCCREITL